MMDLDTIWCKEFLGMMNDRKAQTGLFNLNELDVPKESTGVISHREMALISDITTEYYSKLNGTEPYLRGSGKLVRRKYDYKGEFMRDKEGHFITEPVPVPNDCIAVLSTISIGVPRKFKNDEGFEYVDYVTSSNDSGEKVRYYVYIIPRKYCYKLHQTALILALNKYKNYYNGMSLAMQNGYILYIYIIPYKPSSNRVRNYRILKTKTSVDYTEELTKLRAYWLRKNYIFPPELCVCEDYKGRNNMSYEEFPITLEEYVRYDPNVSMSLHENDMDSEWEDELLEE